MTLPVKIGIDVKAAISETSAGKLVEALTDLISPLTESFGLIGDRIKLHRTETALKVALAAMALIEAQQLPVRLIPMKGLVPLLEKASLEDPDDDQMILMWGKLLAGSVDGNTAYLPRYTTILSELTSESAKLFEHIVARDHYLREETAEELGMIMSDCDSDSLIRDLKREKHGDNIVEFGEKIIYELNRPGVAIEWIMIEYDGVTDILEASSVDASDQRFIPRGGHLLEFSVLEGLGLIRSYSFSDVDIFPFVASVTFSVVTALGYDFYACCNPGKLRRF